MVLPSLGSHAKPLPPRAAALVGHSMLGVREIGKQLDTRMSATQRRPQGES
jgi:hypothetical protein